MARGFSTENIGFSLSWVLSAPSNMEFTTFFSGLRLVMAEKGLFA
jgi:hypothetical protein